MTQSCLYGETPNMKEMDDLFEI